MQQLLIWQDGKVHVDCSVEMLRAALQDQHAVIWLNLQIDNKQTNTSLAAYTNLFTKEFKLTPLALHLIEEERERSRLIEQQNYFYLVVHGLDFNPATIEAKTPKLDIIFNSNFLITIYRVDMPWLSQLLKAVHDDSSAENIMHKGLARLLHAILDALVDSYFPILDDLDDLVDELEDTTVKDASKDTQARIFRVKRALAFMRRVISPQVEVSNALIMRTKEVIPAEAEPYFADVHDHLVRTFEVLDSYRDLMSSLLDVYLTTISNRLNEVMKQLAIISTIFLPITFITGVFGQNFGYMPQVTHDKGYNFWITLLFMGVITLIQFMYFRYRKWL